MRYARNNNPLSLTQSSADKRVHGRIRCRGIECPLGEILDLSATGFRIRLARRVRIHQGQNVVLDLATPKGQQSLRLTVKWVKKVRRSDVQIGLEIVEASDAARQTLSELASALIRSGMLTSNFGLADAA